MTFVFITVGLSLTLISQSNVQSWFSVDPEYSEASRRISLKIQLSWHFEVLKGSTLWEDTVETSFGNGKVLFGKELKIHKCVQKYLSTIWFGVFSRVYKVISSKQQC